MSEAAPYAVVVGLCAHGLAIARSLHRNGVRVFAIEANDRLPGVRTKHAEVRFTTDIIGSGLPDALLALVKDLKPSQRPVLFLTNDRMVETIGGARALEIAAAYRLSWLAGREYVLPLLRKNNIEARCRSVGLNYPKTRVVENLGGLELGAGALRFPVIVKPTQPISAFKTIVADSQEQLLAARDQVARSLPVIVQEFIPGGDRTIRFGALYLSEGRVLARFEGRKLRSRPMGHTTVALSEPDDRIHALTVSFFEGLPISGPVSLELKQDASGAYWVIEPTVGRTDFWVGLCIANGVDLPCIEYRSQTVDGAPKCVQRDTHAWVNGERDPAVVAWLLANAPNVFFRKKLTGVYFDRNDHAPFRVALSNYLRELPIRGARKVWRAALGH